MKHYGGIFDLPTKENRLTELDKLIAKPDLWNDQERAQKLTKERGAIERSLTNYKKIQDDLSENLELYELAVEEGEEELFEELASTVDHIKAAVQEMELDRMLSGPEDEKNAFLSINPGAGGTESQDWAEMLLRMYLRWSERRGYKISIVDYLAGDEAGIKSATISVKGKNAFGYLRAEVGVHRLVRISPYDAQARRHTSFASVFVYPEIDDNIDVVVEDEDLRIDTYRASGAGGQHVNKTDSAVRITHLPTGIVVQCQNERSQHKNKATALKLLRAKLYEAQREERQKELDALHSTKKEIAWGNQIRSYVLQPYQMVKDLRTEISTSSVEKVLDGDLDLFIHSFLLKFGSNN